MKNRPFTDLKIGSEVLIHYKDKRKPEWFKLLGIQGNQENIKKSKGKTGFIIIGEPTRDTPRTINIQTGKANVIGLFPETIEKIECEEEDIRPEKK